MTNPALHNTSLSIGERVKFGVANRLILVLGGRLAANFSAGKAIFSLCLPAVEIQTRQLNLPHGKSIEELIAAETRSKEEMERAERAEVFGQHESELLQKALGDAQRAHKTGDAIRKVTRHLKSKVKKLETQAEAFAQQQTEMLQKALSDARSAHKTSDAIRKVTRHLKSKVKKLESQLEELGTKKPEAILIEDRPDEPVPDRSEPEPGIDGIRGAPLPNRPEPEPTTDKTRTKCPR